MSPKGTAVEKMGPKGVKQVQSLYLSSDGLVDGVGFGGGADEQAASGINDSYATSVATHGIATKSKSGNVEMHQ